jgi:hypothetical protein
MPIAFNKGVCKIEKFLRCAFGISFIVLFGIPRITNIAILGVLVEIFRVRSHKALCNCVI